MSPNAPREASVRSAWRTRILRLIERARAGADVAAERDTLLLGLLRWQARRVAPFTTWLRARRFDPESEAASRLDGWPGLPTEAFRFARVASHGPEDDLRRFRTSGTTGGSRGEHPFRDLSLYEAAARAAAERFLFPGGGRMQLVLLVPSSEEAPDSSLAFMLDRFSEWFGQGEPIRCWREGRLLAGELERACARAERSGEPITLLSTAFALLHAEEALGEKRFRLPPGSRIMPTGGTKGRSRAVSAETLIETMVARYGVPEDHVVGEYGMTELSSQAYEPVLRAARLGSPEVGPRRYVPPPWMRLDVVDPDTLRPLPEGVEGLVRVADPANLDSVALVQTFDLGRRERDGVVLLGRARGAVLRGCSLAAEEALLASEATGDHNG